MHISELLEFIPIYNFIDKHPMYIYVMMMIVPKKKAEVELNI